MLSGEEKKKDILNDLWKRCHWPTSAHLYICILFSGQQRSANGTHDVCG